MTIHRIPGSTGSASVTSSILAVTLYLSAHAIAVDAAPTPAKTKPVVSDTAPTLMDEVVVSANRMDDTAAHIGSAFTKIDNEELVHNQVVDIKRALPLSPGVSVVESGARGAGTEVSLRGNRPDHTLFLVDGAKANSAIFNNASPFLSFASALNLEEVAVVRGPQSMLFGSDAIAGVVSMQTKRGEGTPKTTLFFEGGSYQTFREGVLSAGSIGKLDYSLHYAHDDTANNRRNNDLTEDSGSLRLDWRANERVTLGLSVRTQAGIYEEPGSIRNVDYYNNLLTENVTSASTLLSAYVDWKTTDKWTQKLTLGWYEERYKQIIPGTPENPETSFPIYVGDFTQDGFPTGYVGMAPSTADTYMAHSANYSLDWKHTLQLTDFNRLIAGVDLLTQTGHDNSFADQSNTSVGFYTEDQWEVIHNLVLTGGLRLQHHDLWGDVLTYRFTGSYLVDATHTKLRATYGTGFKSPSFFWLYSTSSFATGNTALKPETSQSWDVGVDQYLLKDRVNLGITYFQSETDNLIDLAQIDSMTWQYLNRNHASTQGIEVSATAKITDAWQARLVYTWLDATESKASGNVHPYYRPQHSFAAQTSYTFFKKLTLGVGVQCVASRLGSDFSTGTEQSVKVEDYTVARVFGRYQINDHFAVTARVENALGEKYVTRIGFPALGTGAYGGIELTF